MATALSTKIRREDVQPGVVLCEHCTAKCCRYFALQIDTPTTREEFDLLRWFLLHGEATLFTEDDDWYLLVHTKCKHLQDDHRCGIYEVRPAICREYTTDDCEYEDDHVYDRYLETSEQVEELADAMFPPQKGQSLRSRKPQLLPVIG